jgi:hypothetical protein
MATEPEEQEDAALEEEVASEVEFSEEDEPLANNGLGDLGQAVLWASDWTTETVIAQMERGNIEMNPRFQRRDAWTRVGKGRFIESLILGLPIPQIVLAEKKDRRGQYIVLDGKQRLLSLLHFSGQGEGRDVGFRLSGLDVRRDLHRVDYETLKSDPARQDDFNAFSTHIIRAVVIRNWPSTEFLHLVFLRLNTGSLKLSPQELRQAIVPGPFSDFADDFALDAKPLQALLGRTSPDPRMRDVELLVRHLALFRSLTEYRGRMKEFLDQKCADFNASWDEIAAEVRTQTEDFVRGIEALQVVFPDGVARKQGSKLFNRSIFDSLIYYAAQPAVRERMLASAGAVAEAYRTAIANERFQLAVESDTAGVPHTVDRIQIWGTALARALNVSLSIPALRNGGIVLEQLG